MQISKFKMKAHFQHILLLFIMAIAFFPGKSAAQLNQGGIPRSFSLSLPPADNDLVTVTPPATDVLLEEDNQNQLPFRFAVNLPVDFGIKTTGSRVIAPDGTNIWRLSLTAPGALALTLYFDQFLIPAGGKLFVYNPGRTQWLGAFTSLNNNTLLTFATGLIQGDQVTLEYNAPDGSPEPLLHISEVAYAYRGIAEYSSLKTGFGSAGKCMVNVNCSEGQQWQNQKRSVARIEVKRGSSTSWCSGSLVNNTLNNATPYILTADHCGISATATDISKWVFYFNYQSAGCPNPLNEPSSRSITGATLVAHSGGSAWKGSDFFMVLLNTAIPDTFDVYYNGWSRETTPSSSGTGIHHPQGDIKKISTYTAPLQPTSYPGNPDLAHWLVTWSATANGHGTTEGGSSGSPIYDPMGRIVGTLTGGDSSCDSAYLGLPDYYGMFSYHWDQNGTESDKKLEPWLDPIKSGVTTLNGWALSVDEPQLNEWVTIYPNPATDHINIVTNRPDAKSLEVRICDILGNRVQTGTIKPFDKQAIPVSLSGLSKGLYLISVSDGDNQVVRKVVKN